MTLDEAGAPPAVLLIEDDRDLAGEILAELETSGHRVRHAATAKDGLEAARAGTPRFWCSTACSTAKTG